MIRAPARVWAPRATRVDLEVDGHRYALDPMPQGCFELPEGALARLLPGARYGFSLDGGPLLPDPQSRDQPEGVLGLSRIVDDAWPWTDASFRARPLSAAVLYEVHVGTFSPEGTFDGLKHRLDHIEDLGITHVELMPVAGFPGRWSWGYDGVALFAPHAGYGGPDALRSLVDACHARGIAVVMDVVYNHLGPFGSVLTHYGPYLNDKSSTPWGSAINFDGPESDEVRAFFLGNARMWFEEYHVDALRLDSVHAIVDHSAVPFLEDLRRLVSQLSVDTGRPLALIAESDLNDPRLIAPQEEHGLGLDAQWNDDFHHALHVALTGERVAYYGDYSGIDDVACALHHGWVYAGQRSLRRARRHGRSISSALHPRLVGFAQNHDQVGNRSGGERLAGMVGPEGAKVALAVVLFAPFIPLLFQGEEWGARTPFLFFADHPDACVAAAVRDGRAAELAALGWRGVPDPSARSTFERSRLDWAERDACAHRDVLAFARALMAFRQQHLARVHEHAPALRCVHDLENQWLRVDRGPCTLVVNLGPSQRVPVRAGSVIELRSREGVGVCSEAVELPPDAAAVLRVR